MAIPHAIPGQAVDVFPAQDASTGSVTQTIVKTDNLELIRLVLPAGKEIAEHKVDGEITVQCLSGRVAFSARGRTVEMRAGQLLFLAGGDPHALRAIEDASVLITILL